MKLIRFDGRSAPKLFRRPFFSSRVFLDSETTMSFPCLPYFFLPLLEARCARMSRKARVPGAPAGWFPCPGRQATGARSHKPRCTADDCEYVCVVTLCSLFAAAASIPHASAPQHPRRTCAIYWCRLALALPCACSGSRWLRSVHRSRHLTAAKLPTEDKLPTGHQLQRAGSCPIVQAQIGEAERSSSQQPNGSTLWTPQRRQSRR